MSRFADPAPPARRRAIESLLGFWVDAGVDALYADAPVDRTQRAERGAALPAVASRVATPPSPIAPSPIAPSGDPQAIRRLTEAALDLDTLRESATVYLRESLDVAFPVFWRGATEAAVIVVGDAPGADDEAAASPFAGPAGRLLDRMLAAAGLTDRALITHTVFWRLPGDRAPTAAEQAICAPFLERAIALVGPRALLLTGAGAAKAMLGREEPILSLHGRWLEWRSADGKLELPALPTLSPAFLLRQPMAKAKSWSDLLTLSERIDRPHRPD